MGGSISDREPDAAERTRSKAHQPRGSSPGWLNVAMDRWAPKTQPARIIFEFALLIPVVLALAIVAKLSQG